MCKINNKTAESFKHLLTTPDLRNTSANPGYWQKFWNKIFRIFGIPLDVKSRLKADLWVTTLFHQKLSNRMISKEKNKNSYKGVANIILIFLNIVISGLLAWKGLSAESEKELRSVSIAFLITSIIVMLFCATADFVILYQSNFQLWRFVKQFIKLFI